jgi:hypothetical protein
MVPWSYGQFLESDPRGEVLRCLKILVDAMVIAIDSLD